MVFIPGGSYQMGGDAGLMDGGSASHQTSYPIHEVSVDPFWMDKTEVTNRQFAEFVAATGYRTFAERPLPEALVAQLKQASAEAIQRLKNARAQASGRELAAIEAEIVRIEKAAQFGSKAGSIVFNSPEGELYNPRDINQWWRLEPEANWRQPSGPGSSYTDRLDHPVVNVTYADAAAYAEWAGKRLPTEAEWERAARGGKDRQPFIWGASFQPEGPDQYQANTWQGAWPFENDGADGFVQTAPVGSFPPNAFGLYDMGGNVWELTADRYHPRTYAMREGGEHNPTGPDPDVLSAYGLPHTIRVTRGGSFLCSSSWCSGYQPGSRQPIEADSPAFHTGFRCVMDIPEAVE
jgi:formylglycine-generating enzyme required for sulfatase activity